MNQTRPNTFYSTMISLVEAFCSSVEGIIKLRMCYQQRRILGRRSRKGGRTQKNRERDERNLRRKLG
jgi:hypothetical protein